jgi:site-specific DNA recombinase
MRIIAATRLSVMSDATTSPERQAESMRDYAKRNGHTIISEVSDLDVSGGRPIRKRPGVGAWLTPEHLDEWDAIAGYSIDRMFRDLYDFVTFWHDFLKPNGKSIIITSENIDMATADGVTMAQMRVMMAENELNKISKRNRDAAEWTRQAGLWKGGQIPWGYRPVRTEYKGHQHWKLEPDPVTADLIREIADEIIAGKSAAQVCRDLTEREIPTGRKNKDGSPRTLWKSGPLLLLLRKETLKGYMTWNHKLANRNGKRVVTYDFVRNPDGTPIRREPILRDVKWAELQEALRQPPKAARGKRRDASMLLHVAKCASCEAWMHYHGFTSTKRSKVYRYSYYFCYNQGNGCKEGSVKADKLEEYVDSWFTGNGHFAGEEIIEHRVIPGTDHKEELAEIDFRITNLDQDAPDYDERHARLRGERKRILALPVTPAIAQDVATGILLRDYWPTLDNAEKRAYLVRAGITVPVRVNPDAGDYLDCWMEGEHPERVRGILARRAAPKDTPSSSSA